jgi:uncharacterized OB-fold protein
MDLDVFEGAVTVPYERSTSPSSEAFLTALRDDGEILGGTCTGCGWVDVPPQDHCPDCGADVSDFEPVGTRGTLLAATTVREEGPNQPRDPPYHVGTVRLEGADAALFHVVEGSGDGPPEAGATVEARFRPEDDREGTLRDIACFEVVG